MTVRDRRATRPSLERVEGRSLLSSIPFVLAGQHPTPTAIGLLTLHADAGGAGGGSGGGGTGSGSGSGSSSGSLGNGFTNNTNTPLLGKGTPTPQELARETFVAEFPLGRYYVGPGRFSDQGTTYYYRGLGGSNQYLHGDFDMAIITPTAPTSPFIGEAVLQDKNTNDGAIQGFILRGNRTDVDAQGRPTHMTLVADPNVYSGTYFVEAAEGTVDIKYGKGPGQPTAVTFHARVYTTGLNSPLVNQDLYARHGRPLKFHGR